MEHRYRFAPWTECATFPAHAFSLLHQVDEHVLVILNMFKWRKDRGYVWGHTVYSIQVVKLELVKVEIERWSSRTRRGETEAIMSSCSVFINTTDFSRDIESCDM